MAGTNNKNRKGMSYLTKKKKVAIPSGLNSETILLKKSLLENGFYNKAIIKMMTETVTCREDLMDCMSKPTFYGTSSNLGFRKTIEKLEWITYPKDKPHQKPIKFNVQKEKIIEDIIELLIHYPIKERLDIIKQFYNIVLDEKKIKTIIRKLPFKVTDYLVEDLKDYFGEQLVFTDGKKRYRKTLRGLSKKEFISLLDVDNTRKNILSHLDSLINEDKLRLNKNEYVFAVNKISRGIQNLKKTSESRYKHDLSKKDAFIREINLIHHFKPLLRMLKQYEFVFDRALKPLSTIIGSLLGSEEFLNLQQGETSIIQINALIAKIKDFRRKSKNLAELDDDLEGILNWRIGQFSMR